MRSFSFHAKTIGKERYLTYILGEGMELDEDTLDFLEEESPVELVRVIFEQDEDYDYLTYDIPVGEAALKNGFCHYNFFSKACNKYYGASPTAIKKQKRAASVSAPLEKSA